MKMILEIFKNNEKVNEIVTTSEKEIYKTLAQVYYTKDNKLATKTIINHTYYNILSITQVFNQSYTQLPNTTYTYKYQFEDVKL